MDLNWSGVGSPGAETTSSSNLIGVAVVVLPRGGVEGIWAFLRKERILLEDSDLGWWKRVRTSGVLFCKGKWG